MFQTRIASKYIMILGAALLALGAILSSACATGGSNTATVSNSNAATPAPPPPPAPLEAREPDRYSVATTITVQPTGNAPQTNIPPMQFTFARITDQRRVSFKLPDPVGEVIYLEKPPMKYLIFPARNQYVELDPNELGFQLGEVMSPASAIQRLKEKSHYEMLGTETVNGRTAIKYRFSGAVDTHTQAGTAQANSIVFVDQETGLPLRSEIDTSSTSGAGARIVTSTDNLQLTADASMFEVPTAMKKVTSTELKQQVQSFVGAMRAVAGYFRQQMETPPPATAGQH
ncbi:MAG TPA: hypothetical protein VN687_08475 [Blastocatellia bacterium]|nr:hypothetical protein [Blastocatellia bacterium]